MTRWLVCGSRTFDDYTLMVRTLTDLANVHGAPVVIINGGMDGADSLSSFYAYEAKIDTECYGAEWGRYGSAAGPRRNERMLAEGRPDLVIAFIDKPLPLSRGTKNMVSLARRAGIPTHVVSL